MRATIRIEVEIRICPAILSQRGTMKELRLLVLADDLTGAMEVGSQFASRGISSILTSESSLEPRGMGEAAQALVIDTETRHVSAMEAGKKVYRFACAARELGIRLLFKKTDSTLRGNIPGEIRALMSAFPAVPVVFAPAYPRMGRIVRDGVLYVHGIPVSETEFGRDRLNPVKDSDIPGLFKQLVPGLQVIVTRPGEVGLTSKAVVCIVDGETEEDLQAAAEGIARIDGPALSAGTAGLAGHLAECLPLERSTPGAWPSIGSCLVVNGSLHDASLRQLDCALSAGWILSAPEGIVRDLGVHRWVLTKLSDFSTLAGEPLAAHVGSRVADIVRRARPDALIVSGGDTAMGILRALGVTVLRPLGEIVPGVAMAVVEEVIPDAGGGRGKQGLVLITKAGGFGPPNVLVQVRALIGRP
jgi:uncharacterized protein YgbK (DUF1537 family)